MILERLVVQVDSDLTGLRNITAGAARMERDVSGSMAGIDRALARVRERMTQPIPLSRLTVGTAAMGFAAKQTFDLGAAYVETASKAKTVFGPEMERVNGFIREFGVTAGLSNREALDLLGTTGAMVQGMGISGRAAADFSMQLTRLAGDLSSFNNVPIAETSAAIQSALTGEREQLKRYGIVIQEAEVQKRALLNTGKANAAQLTQEEKAIATLELVTAKAGVAVGDLARTKDSAANKARALRAEIMNVKESIAVGLLPALAHGVEGLNAFIKGLQITGAEAAVTVARMELAFAKLREGKGGPVADLLGLGEGAGLFDPLGLDLFSRVVGADLTKSVAEAEANLLRMQEAADAVSLEIVGFTENSNVLTTSLDDQADAAGRATGALQKLLAEQAKQRKGGRWDIPNLKPGQDALDLMGMRNAAGRLDFIGSRTEWKLVLDPKTGLDAWRRITTGGIPINMPPNLRPTTPAPTGTGADAATWWDDLKGGIGSFASRVLDPKLIISNIATGLVTSGLSAVLAGVSGVFSSIFGRDPVEAERNRLIEVNTKALEALTGSLARQEQVFRSLTGRDIAGGRFALSPDIFSDSGQVRLPVLKERLAAVGLTMADLRRIAEEFGIELQEVNGQTVFTADALRKIGEGLNALDMRAIFQQWGSGFNLLQQQFAALDIDDPMERFRLTIDFMSSLVREDLANTLRGLTPGNIDAFLASIFDRIRAGDTSLLEQLGGLTLDDFLQGIGSAESALDGLSNTANKVNAALRNVPAGFKIQLARYRADDGLLAPPTTRTDGGGGRHGGFDPMLLSAMASAASRSVDISIDQVVLPNVTDGRSFVDELQRMEESAQWRARTGASVLVVSTRRGG